MYDSPKEVGERLKVSPSTVKRLVLRGELKAIRVGSQVRILVSSVDEYEARQRVATAAPLVVEEDLVAAAEG